MAATKSFLSAARSVGCKGLWGGWRVFWVAGGRGEERGAKLREWAVYYSLS